MNILIADSGATKCHFKWITATKTQSFYTIGISPYFLSAQEIESLLIKSIQPKLKEPVDKIFFYGTGLSNKANAQIIKSCLKKIFKAKYIEINTDMLAAARALCGSNKGIACILGTGSNSCYFDGKTIKKNRAGIGYVLGDEGSGAYLGKKVIQYYLYQTFDEELTGIFEARFKTSATEILNKVYKQPLANRYLAGFAIFLAENRGHYMIENIIEDGLNDFFFHNIYKYPESWKNPISFIGSVAFGFKDVLKELCSQYGLELGAVVKQPMDGLVKFHKNAK